MNLDRKREDFEKLDHQVVKLFDDADQHRQFVLPNGPPEGELVSTCIIIQVKSNFSYRCLLPW